MSKEILGDVNVKIHFVLLLKYWFKNVTNI